MGIFDGQDGERLKNFMLFKAYMTDAEMRDAAPMFVGIFVFMVVVMVGVCLLNKCIGG